MDFKEDFNSGWSYRFRRLLDSGGRADVLLYTRHMDGLPSQEVVLKILRDPQEDLAAILNEGRRLSELKHPNILSTYGYEKIGHSKFALVLEYVKGKNLREISTSFDVEDRDEIARYILTSAFAALREAHSKRIIHGDISSRNILVSDKGQIKLSDFGEARRVGAEPPKGFLRGSVDYLAPERWSGQGTSMEADVFALGVLAYEILSGTNPLRDSQLKSGGDRVAEFLKAQPWNKFERWSEFFSVCLSIEAKDRGDTEQIAALVPETIFGREKLLKHLSQSGVSVLVDLHKTSTLIIAKFSQRIAKQIRFPIILLFLFNSVAIGVDHSLNLGRIKPSSLTLTSSPWGEVFIDDIFLGYTPIFNASLPKGFHIIRWRDKSGLTIRRTVMDYGNGLFAFQIIESKNGSTRVAPLMNSGDKEDLEP